LLDRFRDFSIGRLRQSPGSHPPVGVDTFFGSLSAGARFAEAIPAVRVWGGQAELVENPCH